MKVLKNNLQKESDYPKMVICEHCGSELEYEKFDIKEGPFGCGYVKCPVCGKDTMLDGDGFITLTTDNLKFPIHFNHLSKETGAKDICNEETIRKWVKEGIDFFREHIDQFVWCRASGNLIVFVLRYDSDEEYDVIVSSDYYEVTIPFQKEDY